MDVRGCRVQCVFDSVRLKNEPTRLRINTGLECAVAPKFQIAATNVGSSPWAGMHGGEFDMGVGHAGPGDHARGCLFPRSAHF